jgi:hypothetical protein
MYGLAEPLQAGDESPRTRHSSSRHAGRVNNWIGSDRIIALALSLCCGHGSGAEGEGAIAELVIFRGPLDVSDIEVLEQPRIQQHRIPSLHGAAPEKAWRENTWERQSQALFWQTSEHDWNLEHRVPPLRSMMARHRSVAWKQLIQSGALILSSLLENYGSVNILFSSTATA